MAVIPSASMTTSALSTAAGEAVPTETIFPSSVRMVSPLATGARQSPEMISPRLTIAIFMTAPSSMFYAVQFIRERIGFQQVLHHSSRRIPVVGPEAVTGRDKSRARIKHLVLLMSRPEFGTNRIPAGLQELHLVFRLHRGGTLGCVNDLLDHRILEVLDR